MQAVQVKCPECGAVLNVQEAESIANCGYCGTSSRVQRLTAFLQRPMRMAPAASDEPARIAREVAPRRMNLVLLAIMVVASGGITIAVQLLDRPARSAIQVDATAQPLSARPVPSWNGETPLIADADGDGIDDMIGVTSYSGKPLTYLTAFSGKDGHRLWESSLGADDTTKLALTGGTILRGDAVGVVYAYAVSSGAERWHQPAGERVKQLCAGESPDEIVLETADDRWLQVPLPSGLMTPFVDRSPQPPDRKKVRDKVAAPKCSPLQRADRGASNGATILGDTRLTVDGMDFRRVLARGAGPRIAVGHRSPGTYVPMLAAFDAAGHVTWRIDVPSSEPLRAHWPSNELIVLTDDAVLTVYETNSGQQMLVSIDRATGRRRWEIALDKDPSLTAVAVSRTAVALSGYDLLRVFDLEQGRAIYMIHSR